MVRLPAQVVRATFALAILAALVSAVGAFSAQGEGPRTFATLHGTTVELSGRGLYADDTKLIAAGNRGTDAATLFLEVPVLLVALFAARRGSLRGGLVLCGVLGFFLYYEASMALGTAWNRAFLAFVVLFSLSLFTFIAALSGITLERTSEFVARFPRRRMLAYLIALTALFPLVWLPEPLVGTIDGRTPAPVASYTTVVAWVLDVGVIAPAAAICAVLLVRDDLRGYLFGTVLLVLNVAAGVALLAQAAAQYVLGVTFSMQEWVIFVGSFAVMTAVASALAVRVLR